MKKQITIGHVDHGGSSLTAALVKVLASGIHVEEGPPSWYCDQCHVEVRQVRCVHCGKSKRERS